MEFVTDFIKNGQQHKECAVAKKVRVLHIAEAPGGVERYLVALLTKLKQNYSDQLEHILVCSDSIDSGKFEGIVSKIEHVGDMHHPISAGSDLRSIMAVRGLIRKYKPDIVYCHSSKAGAIGRMANFGMKNRQGEKNACVYNAHGWAFNMKGASDSLIKSYVMTEKMLAPITNSIICISEFEKNTALVHEICDPSKLTVIYNGIDLDEEKICHTRPADMEKIPDGAFVVGMVGRLATQKAPDIFVKAASVIKQRIPEAFFVIVGDGLNRMDTERMVREYGLMDSFLITGWVNDPFNYICNFDVAMLMSRWEGFGLVLPEYMLTRKPIVASNVDAIPEIIQDGVNGLLVEREDYYGAAEAVIKLHDDPGLCEYLVNNAFTIVKDRFNVERTAREHRDLFMRLVGKEETEQE